MEDFIGLIIFLAIGIISAISKAKENKGSAIPSLPRKKPPQKLNRRPLNQGQVQGRKLDNVFQHNLPEEPKMQEPRHEDHAVFEHDHPFEEEKTVAIHAVAAKVEYGHSRATQFADFIKTDGQNAIVMGEILGKPKGWE